MHLGRRDEPNIGAPGYGALQGDREIDDLDLALDERPPGAAVLPTPFHVGEGDAVPFDKEARSPVDQGIDEWRGTGRLIVVELSGRSA
jgi:hypothetical protein